MSIREVNPSSLEVDAIAEAHLQEELRGLFVVDTQNYLQKYSQLAQGLQPEAWKTDIQELYRCIHTIKGGAVTVAAEAVLQVSTALEDLLSDLRYLEVAPLLADQHLQQSLLEAGELLAGVLVQDTAEIEPILHRVKTLHQEVQERYLPQWDPQRQLHQDFAEQGLDMVVLELQIALERLPTTGLLNGEFVPPAMIDTARQTVAQLLQIGNELQLASGWTDLLHRAEELMTCPTVEVWRSQWFLLFQALKTCAKQSGNPIEFEWTESEEIGLERTEELAEVVTVEAITEANKSTDATAIDLFADNSVGDGVNSWEEPSFDSFDIGSFLDNEFLENEFLEGVQPSAPETAFTDTLDNLTNNPTNNLLESVPANDSVDNSEREHSNLEVFSLDEVNIDLHEEGVTQFVVTQPFLQADESDQQLPTEFQAGRSSHASSESVSEFEEFPEFETVDLLDDQLLDDQLESHPSLPDISAEIAIDQEPQSAINSSESQPKTISQPETLLDPAKGLLDPAKVQIPVSLEKLDRSAQYLVETLLALRSTQGSYGTLQNQLAQLVTLAQEGMQSITWLRQIQDDYALLNLQSQQAPQGLTPERYRQGYTVINRLLETNLRLAEIGAEAGKTTEQITENLRSIDGSVLKLQNTIEDSRLVSFQSLGIRARAVLRDLVTRYGKSARLIILGEQTELDVGTARALEPALLHLIRNAFDHGLESPTERVAQGKPEQGTIVLSLRRRGNQFSLEFKDDGCGIDAEEIRARAEAAQFPLTQTATAEALLRVICQPGFSSEAKANELSGRGVGMDVVAAQVARLGGQLSLHTVPGTGTTFQIQFPAPRLLVPCVLVRAGDYTFAVPEDEIKTITLLGSVDAVQTEPQNGNSNPDGNLDQSDQADLANPVGRWIIQNEAGSAPALDLLEYWQPHLAGRSLPDTAVCLWIETQNSPNQAHLDLERGVWLLADELLEQSELVINVLPSPLTAPTGVMGVSLQVNGSLVPVLEARALAEWWLSLPVRQTAPAAIGRGSEDRGSEDLTANRWARTILVVDDAALMRRRLEASLSANGYTIHTCSDGQEAWHWLQEHPSPSLILTDIEMPNMDGFTLIDRCRQAGITVPILVVSSRLSEEWFNEARRLGATDYLTKGFATVELINKVNRLLNGAGATVTTVLP